MRCAVSPDGKLLAGARAAEVGLWQTSTGALLRTIPVKCEREDRLAFSPDGKRLVVLGKKVRVWDPDSARPLRTYSWPFGGARPTLSRPAELKVIFPPSGKALALAGRTRSVEVWELETGRPITPPAGHDESIAALAFSADGKFLHSGDGGAHLLRWDLATGKAEPRFPASLSNPTNLFGSWPTVTFGPGAGRVFVSEIAMRLRVRIFDRASGKFQALLRRPTPIRCARGVPAFSRDGKRYVLQCEDSRRKADDPGDFDVAVRDADTDAVVRSLKVKGVFGVNAALSADGSRLVTGALYRPENGPKEVELTGWDLKTGKALARARVPGTEGRLSVAADGRSVLVYHRLYPGRLLVWDLLTGQTRRSVTCGWDYATSGPLFSPDGRTFALTTCDDSGKNPTIRVYEWATLTERYTWRDYEPSLNAGDIFLATAISPDGKTLASGNGNGVILLWDLAGTARPARRAPPAPERLWEGLANPGAKDAWPALRELAARPAEAIRLFRSRLTPLPAPPGAARVAALVEQLDADSAARRDAATAALARVARLIEPELRKARQAAISAEVKKRLDRLLAPLGWLTPDEVREVRAVEVLERIDSDQARALLRQWAAGPAAAVRTAQAKAALERLAGK
jgi:WD40 repeat protein